MSRFREIDLSRVRARSVDERTSLVALEGLSSPVEAADARILDRFPDQLGARSLRRLVGATVSAVRARRPVAVMIGGHVIKTGCGPCLIQLMEAGALTVLAMNGSAAIHDFELATLGRTSEDVEAGLDSGSFGMAEETTRLMNRLTSEAAAAGDGLGETLGRYLASEAPHAERSVLAATARLGIPATVHVALGTDILHMHPTADGGAIGAASLRDFRILTAALEGLSGGVVLNLGSAVLLPEVFLKALSVLLNLGETITDLTTGDFDFLRHYRPTRNVVQRPTAGGRGAGYSVTGHHEILIPLYAAGVLRGLAEPGAGSSPGVPHSPRG